MYSQSYGFSSSHFIDVSIGPQRRLSAYELMLLNYGTREGRLLRPLDCKEIKPVNPKEISPEYSLEDTLWPPDVKNWFIGKDPDAGGPWSFGITEGGRRGQQKMR